MLAVSNPSRAIADMQKWESVLMSSLLLVSSLDEQCEFADYVTRKMCKQSDLIKEEFARSSELHALFPNNCTIGNVACLIRALPDGPVRERLSAEFTATKWRTLRSRAFEVIVPLALILLYVFVGFLVVCPVLYPKS